MQETNEFNTLKTTRLLKNKKKERIWNYTYSTYKIYYVKLFTKYILKEFFFDVKSRITGEARRIKISIVKF